MSESTAFPPPLDFHAELDAVRGSMDQWGSALSTAYAEALAPGVGSWWLAAIAMFVIGVAGERIICRKLDGLSRRITEAEAQGWMSALGLGVFRVLFDAVGVLLFYGIAWVVLYLLVDSETPIYSTLGLLLGAVLTFRLCMVLARAVLAPHHEGIRSIPLSSADAASLYRGVMIFAGVYIASQFNWAAVLARIEPEVLGRATGVLIGVGLGATLVGTVLFNRRRLANLFRDEEAGTADPSTLKQIVAQSWPYLFVVWVCMLWANWAFSVFTVDLKREHSAMLSWWITLLFPAIDRLCHAFLVKAVRVRLLDDSGFAPRRQRFVKIVQGCIRVILIGVALIAMAINWNLLGTDMLQSALGARVIWGAIEIGLIGLVAYVLYEVVMALLEKHMPDDSDGEPEEMEGEGGGVGATREETLAPLLRGTFLVVLGVVVMLTVLSALGVQILPLIAGASIVGVAIGFGSQKLVQDVISGVFFLIDDAFRRGEYIDVGSVKGTVEKISIRSMQLRHHMGALHTIPFGEIRHLTNFSRDWVMMKLKLRLPYETDIERVRKLIKKLGQTMLEDSTLGEMFLQPLKSQGVYSMEDDSAMILRVKFMTRPGDQFVVRKAVYASIRELFEQEGIEFAHRVVKVQLDGKEPHELTPEERQQVAGAALAASHRPAETAGTAESR